jgi:hypothetical protein
LVGAKGRSDVTPFLVDDDHLAGFDVADEVGADDVERAGLRGDDVGVAELAQHQRAHAQRIAHADHHVLGDQRQRIGALDLVAAHRSTGRRHCPGDGRHQMD